MQPQQDLWQEFLAFKLDKLSLQASTSSSPSLPPAPHPSGSVASAAAAANTATSPRAAVGATPATVAKQIGRAGAVGGHAASRGAAVAAAIQMDAQPEITRGKEFLGNRDLFGLEPALSHRTRILLASLAQTQMSPLDIAKSFEIAGYFPRKR